jgi:signal transduction histidine kinase
MKFTLIFSFSVLLILQLGVLFVTLIIGRYFKDRKGYRYWLMSVGFSCLGYLLSIFEISLSSQISKLSLFVTSASICFGISQSLQVLVFQRLDGKVHSKNIAYFIFSTTAVYILLFDYGRQSEDFVFRGVLTSIFYCISGFLELYLLNRFRYSNKALWSNQLYLPIAAIIFNLIASVIRSIYLLYPKIHDIPYETSTSVVIFSASQIFFTLMFIGISYYWVEELGIINRKISFESKEVQALLVRKERALNEVLLSQKSALLGAYSHLVSHEVNQPLATLQIHADFLKELLLPRADLVRENGLVNSIIVENIRAATIIRTIRGLLTQEKAGSTFFSIDKLAKEIETVIRKRMVEKKIELNLVLNASTFIFANKNELQLVLFNLLENSISALASSSNEIDFIGKITLETSFEEERVVVKVVDNGPGVKQESREFLFDLHNTSKTNGTGMGLWLSSFIAKRHNGRIIYDGSIVNGAAFSLEFPRIHQ